MDSRDALSLFLLFLELPDEASLMRSASIGEIFAASRAGRRQEISTVRYANTAEPIKITGLADTV